MASDFDPADTAARLIGNADGGINLPDNADADDAEEHIADMLKQFSSMNVPEAEAVRGVKNQLNIDESPDPTDVATREIGEIASANKMVTVEGEVTRDIGTDSPKIAQLGIIGDDTGDILYKSFESDNVESLEVGQAYRLTGVKTDEYEGDYSIILNERTTVEVVDDSFNVPENRSDPDELDPMPIVDVTDNSGLIVRDPETGEKCDNLAGTDTDEAENSLQVICRVDDGDTVRRVVVGHDETAALMDALGADITTVERAFEVAQDAFNMDVVTDRFAERLLGRWVAFEGDRMDDDEDDEITYYCTDFEIVEDSNAVRDEAEKLLETAADTEEEVA